MLENLVRNYDIEELCREISPVVRQDRPDDIAKIESECVEQPLALVDRDCEISAPYALIPLLRKCATPDPRPQPHSSTVKSVVLRRSSRFVNSPCSG